MATFGLLSQVTISLLAGCRSDTMLSSAIHFGGLLSGFPKNKLNTGYIQLLSRSGCRKAETKQMQENSE
jgi:hypothetical protein